MLGLVLGVFGKRVLGKALGKTVKAIEARNGAAQADTGRSKQSQEA